MKYRATVGDMLMCGDCGQWFMDWPLPYGRIGPLRCDACWVLARAAYAEAKAAIINLRNL